MKTLSSVAGLALLVAAAGSVPAAQGQRPGFTLTTTAFQDGGVIPAKYTQSVKNPASPKLEWSHAPEGTQSFALLMHDPDVARDKKYQDVLHWFIFNIPASATGLPEGVPNEPTLSDGAIQIKNQGGVPGYRGPGAPAAGPYHHYTLELFALDTKLDLGADATRDQVMQAIDGHILGKAVLVGRFHR
ncbi:MAG TPA: YbhB/YbcL family Raf kinase inhibitor-like protein [Vicinamibacterales bacterium]|jgi:hypothetical protein